MKRTVILSHTIFAYNPNASSKMQCACADRFEGFPTKNGQGGRVKRPTRTPTGSNLLFRTFLIQIIIQNVFEHHVIQGNCHTR